MRGDDGRLEAVYRNFEANERDIVGIARNAGIRAVLATVVSNLRDCPPFASLHRPGMPEAELAAWNASYAEGQAAWELGNQEDALQWIEAASKADPGFAEAHFLLGGILMGRGDTARARSGRFEAPPLGRAPFPVGPADQ